MNNADTSKILAKLTKKDEEICRGDSKAYDQITLHIPPRSIFEDEKPQSQEAPLATWMKSMQVSAVGFAAVDECKIACVGVAGRLDPSNLNSPPVTIKTMFPIASITKPMVAYAVIRVLEKYNAEHKSETKITLDSPIDRFFPPIPNTYPFTFDKRKITGSLAAKIIFEMSENNPVKTLALITQFKEWVRVNHRRFNMQDVNKLEREILSKNEFLFGSWQTRNLLRKFVGQGITIRELLEHSSGIRENIGIYNPKLHSTSTAVSLAWLHGASVERETPSVSSYSNSGYILIEMLLESLFQKPFPKIMQNYVFDPLGMENSTVSESVATFNRADKQFVYCQRPDGVVPDKREMMPRGCGGVYTTPEDLAIFMQELIRVYNDPSSDPVKEMFQKQNRKDPSGNPCNYGLGVYVFGSGDNLMLQHNGNSESSSASMYIYPTRRAAEVVVMNNRKPDFCTQVLSAISATYIFPENPHLQISVLTPLSDTQVKKFMEYQGEYKMIGQLENIKVTLLLENGRPALQFHNTKLNTPPETFLLSQDIDRNIVSLNTNMKLQFNDSNHTIELPEIRSFDPKKGSLQSTGMLISESKQETSDKNAEIPEQKRQDERAVSLSGS